MDVQLQELGLSDHAASASPSSSAELLASTQQLRRQQAEMQAKQLRQQIEDYQFDSELPCPAAT